MSSFKCDEVFGMLLTFLTLPVEEQLSRIDSVPKRGDSRVRSLKQNDLANLLDTLYEYYNYWWDRVEPSSDSVEQLWEHIKKLDLECSEESFRQDEAWINVRNLANESLAEAGNPIFSVPDKLDFEEYIEILD